MRRKIDFMWHRERHKAPPNNAASHDADVDAPASICDERFLLEDRILGTHTEGLWRAFDVRLNRQVSIRLVPPSNPKRDELRVAACAAARVVDTRVARVLDVLDNDGTLVIVTEWVDGVPLEQLLRTEFPAEKAVPLIRDVASTVAEMHAIGASHGRIRPASVMITREGDFRLRGHSIDVALWGVSPGSDAQKADISGIGSLLTACLTHRWPGEAPTDLPQTPTLGGTLALPSQMVADLPGELDEIVVRAMGSVPNARTVPTQRPYRRAEQVYAELAHFVDSRLSSAPVEPRPSKRREPLDSAAFMKRSGLIAALAAIAIGALLVSARLFIEDPATTAAISQDAVSRASAPEPSSPAIALLPPSDTVAVSEYRIPILRAREVVAGELPRSPSSAPEVIDTDLTTGWEVTYGAENVDVQDASGVIIDLGTPRPVRALTIGLLGNDTDFSIYRANRLTRDLKNFRKVGDVESAPGLLTLRQPRPVIGRYFYFALTAVPQQDRLYHGGITSIAVFGG